MKLSFILEHKSDSNLASVGVVLKDDTVLLGLSNNDDSRYNHWCFPGGHKTHGESDKAAAVREVREETGIKCLAQKVLGNERNGKVRFVKCKYTSGSVKPNSEFKKLKFIPINKLDEYKLFHNVRKWLDKANGE